jgi:predicted dehydrogenase
MTDQSVPADGAESTLSRRGFLQAAAAAGVFTIVPRHVLGGPGNIPPSEKVNIAIIGTGGQGQVNMKQLLVQPDAHIVALCDVNEESDYSAFYYGGKGGLKSATEMVRKKYGEAPKTYRDYKKMLDQQKDIDAVLLATPDHSHCMIALDVLAHKKHLYCEKPLCRTIYETRLVTEAARKAGVATQMGNYGHSSEDIRLACEWIWDGAIGEIKEVHAWTNTGAQRWSDLREVPKDKPPVPKGFDWNRWVEPVPFRPYHPQYAPVRWRAWWQFGSGTIGDFACHHLDSTFWALKLDQCQNFSVEASSAGCTDEMCPAASLVYFDMPARAGLPPVRITWYEGGIKPARPKELEAGRKLGDHGTLFIGTKGAILSDGWAKSPRIIPEAKMQAYKRPAKTLHRVKGHHRNWLDACLGKDKACTHFDYAGPLTEFVLMGNVAIRAGKRLDFDWKNMKVTNVPEANQYIKPKYREGMEIKDGIMQHVEAVKKNNA